MIAGEALAQSAHPSVVAPSAVTPNSLQPPQGPQGTVSFGAAPGLQPPPNAANLAVTISSVIVQGGFPELQAQTDKIVGPLKGRRITVAELYAAANAIEQAYAQSGYVLVRVAVPPQQLQNGGAVKLLVIDGFIELIDAKSIPEPQRAFIAARLNYLIGKKHLLLSEIERSLLLAAATPGVVLRSTVERGDQVGGARLVIEADLSPEQASLTFDNHLPPSLGSFAWTASGAVNDVLGMGEQIYATATTGYNVGQAFNGTSPLELVGGGFSVPIGLDGFRINPEYTYSVSRTAATAGVPETTGYYQRFDLRASYPVLLSRSQTLTLFGTYEWAQESLVASGFAQDIYLDQYNVARFRGEDQLRALGGVVNSSLEFSQGLGGRDAPQPGTGTPVSQQGATPTFSKALGDIRWLQPVAAGFQTLAIVDGQTSFGEPLFVAEQFPLDGPDAVSAYPLGTLQVDQGVTVRGELQRPFTFENDAGRVGLTPYLFGAGAWGMIDQPTAVQLGSINASGFGAGLRTSELPRAVPIAGAFSIEFARGYSNVPGEGVVNRCNFSFSATF